MAYESKFGVKKGSPAEKNMIKIRNDRMYAMMLRGHSPEDICKECNVSLSTYRVIIPKMIEANARNMGKRIAMEITVQLNQLSQLYNQAIVQWEKSCEAALEVEKTEEGFSVDGDTTGMKVGGLPAETPKPGDKAKPGTKGAGLPAKRSVTTKHKQRTGDPRYLSEARQILAERRRILGLDDAEVKATVINQFFKADINTTINAEIASAMSMDELAAVSEIMKNLNIAPGGTPLAIAGPQKDDDNYDDEDEDGIVDGEFTDEDTRTATLAEDGAGEDAED